MHTKMAISMVSSISHTTIYKKERYININSFITKSTVRAHGLINHGNPHLRLSPRLRHGAPNIYIALPKALLLVRKSVLPTHTFNEWHGLSQVIPHNAGIAVMQRLELQSAVDAVEEGMAVDVKDGEDVTGEEVSSVLFAFGEDYSY